MRYAKGILLLLPCLYLLTGCWDKMEVEERGYVITFGIDKFQEADESLREDEEEENNFTVSLGMAALEKTSGGEGKSTEEESNVRLLSGKSFASSLKLSDLYSSKQTYFGQTKAVILGADLLRDSKLLREALDALERDQEINMKIILLATDGKAYDNIKIITDEEDPSGLFLWDFYKNNAKEVSATQKLDFESLLISLRKNGSALIPLVRPTESGIKLGGGAILKDYTLCGYLNDKQMRGCLFVQGDGEGAVIDCDLEDDYVPVRVLKNTSKVSFYEENGRAAANIKINVKGNIEGYTIGGEDLLNDSAIEKIEENCAASIEAEVEQAIAVLQKDYGVDVLHFEDKLYKKNDKFFERLQEEGREQFSQMTFHITVRADISGIGMIK